MIRKWKKTDAVAIAKIHIKALPGDFLPELGHQFLTIFYMGIVELHGVYGFVNVEKKQVSGFVIGSLNIDTFFKNAIRANFFKLAFQVFRIVLLRPRLIKNVLETFLYTKRDPGSHAELVIIAVDKIMRGKGVGRLLIKQVENAFRRNKIKRYRLTVQKHRKSVLFYKHLKFIEVGDFCLYGKQWHMLEKNL